MPLYENEKLLYISRQYQIIFDVLFTYIKYILICQTIDINSRWIIEACAPFENIILQKPCFPPLLQKETSSLYQNNRTNPI